MVNFLVPVTVNALPSISELEGKQGMFVLPDGSININRKNGTWMVINKQSDHAGVLKPADVPVIQPGDAKWWWAGSGTYTNAGGKVIEKQGIISYDGSDWGELELDLPDSASTAAEMINFSENIYFDKQSIAVVTVTGPITFKPIGTNAKLMGSTLVRLTADGVNIPDFSKFKKLNGSQDYDNTNGVLNSIFFFYDGFDAWVNIWQGIGDSDIDFSDATPPTAPTIQITDTQDKSVALSWTGATDNVAVTSYEIYANGILKNTASASPFTVTNLNPSTLYEFKIKAKDAAGNTSVFSNAVSTTTLSPQSTPIIFNILSSGASFSNNTLTFTSASTGGVVTPYVNTVDGFELILGDSTDVAVLMITEVNNGSYVWVENTPSLILAIFRTNGTIQLVKKTGTLLYTHNGNEAFARIKRVGNNAVMGVSSDGNSWTDVYTETNAFASYNTAYIKALLAAGSNGTMKAYTKN